VKKQPIPDIPPESGLSDFKDKITKIFANAADIFIIQKSRELYYSCV
jgi:hypothetical protein